MLVLGLHQALLGRNTGHSSASTSHVAKHVTCFCCWSMSRVCFAFVWSWHVGLQISFEPTNLFVTWELLLAACRSPQAVLSMVPTKPRLSTFPCHAHGAWSKLHALNLLKTNLAVCSNKVSHELFKSLTRTSQVCFCPLAQLSGDFFIGKPDICMFSAQA
jgi:hypothetical protein